MNLADPLVAIALMAAINVMCCVACYVVGRMHERRLHRPAAAEPCRCVPPPAFRNQRPLFHR